jgi:hypothetical protein
LPRSTSSAAGRGDEGDAVGRQPAHELGRSRYGHDPVGRHELEVGQVFLDLVHVDAGRTEPGDRVFHAASVRGLEDDGEVEPEPLGEPRPHLFDHDGRVHEGAVHVEEDGAAAEGGGHGSILSVG